jgi:two-component system chemotaxis sensor kinase CheA
MPTREELRNRLLQTFREEAAEHLVVIESELDFLRTEHTSQAAGERLQTLFRTMHTLKGAARSVQLTAIEKICHEYELELRHIANGTNLPSRVLLEKFTQSLKQIRENVAALDRGAAQARPDSEPVMREPAAKARNDRPDAPAMATARPTPVVVPPDPGPTLAGGAVAAPAFPAATQRGRTDPVAWSLASIRVDIGKLDRLMLAAEDLLLPSLAVSERRRAMRGVLDDVSGLRTLVRSKLQSIGGRESSDATRGVRNEILTALRGIEMACRRVTGALAEDDRLLRATVSDLYLEMRHSRVLPVGAMFAAFPAMVRDLCEQTGKRAVWMLNDSGLEVDRKVIDMVKDPLIHMVRNAIDHGIESPTDRKAAGKPAEGRVSITVTSSGAGRVSIEIADDGRGFDVETLRDAAVRARILSRAQAAELADREVIALAFRSGVSTNAVVTSISGLGLGLSIAQEQAERIGGRIAIDTTRNVGTRITLELPTTIASYRGILVRVGDTKLLFPADAVERVIGLPQRQLKPTLQAGYVAHGGASLPFAQLAAVLGLPASARPSELHIAPCVIVQSAQRMAAVVVDEVMGEAEVLVKDFPPPIRRVKNLASIGLLGTGELSMVLRPSDIVSAVYSGTIDVEPQSASSSTKQLRLLVVDDSITTRTMERNLFENAGYAVMVAVDGVEAWSLLQSEPVDLVVSDVDMPRMNGFELTEAIRKDPRLGELPIVLVTALETRDDKERGIRSGANAYVLKSSFDQSNLLEIVGRLI